MIIDTRPHKLTHADGCTTDSCSCGADSINEANGHGQLPLLCLYHRACSDGQGAAAAFATKFKYVEYLAVAYGEPAPNVKGRTVYILDFSFPLETMKQMCEDAEFVTIIDHHETAVEQLKDFEHPKLKKVLDMTRSGAVLTWQWAFPDKAVPPMLLHIEDRDLWNFDLAGTREIVASLYSMDFRPDWWAELMTPLRWARDIDSLVNEGRGILKADKRRVAQIVEQATTAIIGGYVVPFVNCPHFHASDVGQELAKGQFFSASYQVLTDSTVKYSLRSNKKDPMALNVRKIAEQYGGGGHPSAAGFQLSISQAFNEGLL